MLRCTCCGRWTVEVITDLDRRHTGRRGQPFYRVTFAGRLWDEYLTLAAAEAALAEQGVLEYLAEVPEAA